MIKINLLSDALGSGGVGGKKGRAIAVPAVAMADEAPRTSIPILGIVVGLVFLLAGVLYYLNLKRSLEAAKEIQAKLEVEKKALEPYTAKEKLYRERKEALAKKEEVMVGLKKSQQLPVHLLEEIANSLPDDVWFGSLTQKGKSIVIEGEGRSFESINVFYQNLQSRSRWFKNLSYPGGGSTGNRSIRFTMTFELQNPL